MQENERVAAPGAVLAQMGHFPFGESWYNATGDKLLFTTYERDAESGNDYAMARMYVNRLALFSALDPLSGDISDPQSLNRYQYVRNDPTNWVDPTGMNLAKTCQGFCGPGSPGSTFDPGGGLGLGTDVFPIYGLVGEGDLGVIGNLFFGSLPSPTGGGGGSTKYTVNLKVLNDCLSRMGIHTTINSLTPSTPGGYGEAKGAGVDWFSGHGNTVPITVINDANTYNAAQVGQMCNLPWAQGCTDRTHPYTNYTNNNNNAYGTVDTQVWELGNSLWQIQAGSPVVPRPTVEPGKTLENCVRTHNGIQPQ